MLVFSPCKINLGLNVVRKRSDGYHDIETVFYPILWHDALEVIEDSENQCFNLTISGLPIEGDLQNNVIYKTHQLIQAKYPIPPIKVHLYKNLPMGAGIGGGSANAATFINLMNAKFNLNIPLSEKLNMASQIGSDCSFFIENKPVFATEKGNIFENINVDLSNYYILLVYPKIHSNTKLAYQGIEPIQPKVSIKKIIETEPIENWKNILVNDFEKSVFKSHLKISELKEKMYLKGAVYASMSGSGSTVFGIFKEKPIWESNNNEVFFIQEKNQSKV